MVARDEEQPVGGPLDLQETERLLRARATQDLQTAGRILNRGRDAIYRAAKDGSLPTIKIGGRRQVPSLHLLRLLGLEPPETARAA